MTRIRRLTFLALLGIASCSKHTALHEQHLRVATKAIDEEVESYRRHVAKSTPPEAYQTRTLADFTACRPIVLAELEAWFTRWEAYHSKQDPRCGLAEQLHSVKSWDWIFAADRANGSHELFEQHHQDVICSNLRRTAYSSALEDAGGEDGCGAHAVR